MTQIICSAGRERNVQPVLMSKEVGMTLGEALGERHIKGDGGMRVLQMVAAVAALTMVVNMPEARAAEGFTSFGPKEAERKYESAVKQARQTYLAELRRTLSSMLATQIDEANRVNTVIKRLEAEIAGRPAEPSTEPQSTTATLVILKATYAGPNKSKDVTKDLQEMVKNDQLVIEQSRYALFGDVQPGAVKLLTVRYRLGGRTETVKFQDNEEVRLPPPGKTRAEPER